jgi:hypothetical protein
MKRAGPAEIGIDLALDLCPHLRRGAPDLRRGKDDGDHVNLPGETSRRGGWARRRSIPPIGRAQGSSFTPQLR